MQVYYMPSVFSSLNVLPSFNIHIPPSGSSSNLRRKWRQTTKADKNPKSTDGKQLHPSTLMLLLHYMTGADSSHSASLVDPVAGTSLSKLTIYLFYQMLLRSPERTLQNLELNESQKFSISSSLGHNVFAVESEKHGVEKSEEGIDIILLKSHRGREE
jgi:hypothetical protein